MIQVGDEWTRGVFKNDGRIDGERRVKVLAIEGTNVLIEEIEQPAHKEYGHPRRWVPSAAFIDDSAELFGRET